MKGIQKAGEVCM